ncbi:MAG: PD-(D/E)XK nuclease family protein [Myxococcales bacterium]|nr:PD-(D/E)XK nuclease family protein [Myxococcales bacterium]
MASRTDGTLTVIDFKTDRAPTRSAREEYPAYVKQVRQYAAVLERGAGPARDAAGLLFTETGRVEWCEGG